MQKTSFLVNTFSALAITSLAATTAMANNDLITNHSSGLDYAAIGDTQSPNNILILLHGSGDDYKGLAGVGEAIAKNYDDLLILVPNGTNSFAEILEPVQIEQIKKQNPNIDLENMRNWAGRVDLNGQETEDEIMQLLEESQYEASDALNNLIQTQLNQYGLTESDVSLYGFSAGGALAMVAGMRDENEYAKVLNHSGVLFGPYENPTSTPPIKILIGDRETNLIQGLSVMVEALQAEGIDVTYEILENTGHEVNENVLPHFRNLIDELVADDDPAPSSAPSIIPN